METKLEKAAHKIRSYYEVERVQKQKKQIQVLDEIPENNKTNKRLFFPSGTKKCGTLMQKAKKEFINCREVLNLRAMKFSRAIIPSSSSSCSSKLLPKRKEVEEKKKQKRQIQFLQEIPILPEENNEKKRKIAPSSASVETVGSLMKKAKKEFLNSEVRSSPPAVASKVSSTFDHSLPITHLSISEDKKQILPEKKRTTIRIKFPPIQKPITISKEDNAKESSGEKH